MADQIIVKAGSETPDPVTGMSYPILKCLAKLRAHCQIVITENEDEQTLIDAVRGATDLMITYGNVSEQVIKAGMPTLKAIIKMGTGIDFIDFAAAREHGVRVTNCPGYARYAVAENAFMLMINCRKNFIPIHNAVRNSGWLGATEETKSHELFGRSVGFVGFGHINQQLAKMCSGFGMHLQAYSRGGAESMVQLGVEKIESLDALAAMSDVVAICVPLTSDTHHIIDAAFLGKMKSSAILINVGRGG